MYIETTALNKILSLRKRIRGVAGGTSASKTISILQWLIDYAQCHDKKILSVVSETMPHLRKGAMRDFKSIMDTHNYWKASNWNETNSVYTFESGSIIEFFSADNSSRVRGPRRDVLFINEANNVSYETYEQLEIRTNEIIWLDWNPVTEFWFYTEVKDKEDVDFLILTYKDNEALSEAIVKTIESRMDKKNWWRVYGEGLLGEAEGLIYSGWKDIDEIPEEARLVRRGLDFGYTNDPTALVDIYKWNNAYIWDEVLYRKGMSNKDIADVILNTQDELVIADSAEPKSIDEIRGYGVNIIPSNKGAGSVLQGVQYVQDQTIYLTKRSTNIRKEQRNYLWMTDKDGKIINVPQDFLNHAMDGGRYAMESLRATDSGIEDAEWEEHLRVNQSLLRGRGY